jgi:hypothetical protein
MSAPQDRTESLARTEKISPDLLCNITPSRSQDKKKDFVLDSYKTGNVNCTCKVCREKGTVNQMCAVLNYRPLKFPFLTI